MTDADISAMSLAEAWIGAFATALAEGCTKLTLLPAAMLKLCQSVARRALLWLMVKVLADWWEGISTLSAIATPPVA